MKARANRRNAKMDLMTGFTGEKPPDLDLGLKGNGYFERWTTLSLPDTGKNSAVDDDQQPRGAGAPETSVDGPPLKVPMEAEDVGRPRIREGREARRRQALILRRVAMEIRRLEPGTARRLMAAADELNYDALSTASLPESGDEDNEVDDYHDNFGHGKLQFFGTDPPKPSSLTRESSRRRSAGEASYSPCEVSYQYPGKNWEKQVCKTQGEYDDLMGDLKKEGAETRVKYLDHGKGEVDTNLQYASRGASRRRKAAEGKGIKDVDWNNTLKLVESAMQGRYDASAVANILKSDYDRTMGLLRGGHQSQAAGNTSQQTPTPSDATAGAKGWSLQAHRNTRPRRKQAGVDWIDIENAADDFIRTGKGPDEVTVVDVARALGLNHGDATKALGPVQEKMQGKMGAGDPRDRDPGPNQMLGSRRKRARTQGDKELHPQPTVGDQDGPGADGAGGFVDQAKAPLQKTMTAEDVDRPKIRENPEAARSLWGQFKSELLRTAGGGGKWNSGQYSMEARDYGDSVEVQASVIDRENMHMPVGSILFSVLQDSPKGRYATVEINDGIMENRTTEFTLRKPRQATLIVSRLVGGITRTAKDILNGVTV